MLEGVHVLRTLDDCLALRDDLDDLPERVVVVGAGVHRRRGGGHVPQAGASRSPSLEGLDVPARAGARHARWAW